MPSPVRSNYPDENNSARSHRYTSSVAIPASRAVNRTGRLIARALRVLISHQLPPISEVGMRDGGRDEHDYKGSEEAASAPNSNKDGGLIFIAPINGWA